MKQKTKIGISIGTGLLPCWYMGYLAAMLIQGLTSRTEMVGNRKMLFYLHPALMLGLSAVIAIALLYGWHQIFGRLWEPLISGLKKLKNIRIHPPETASIKTALSNFFTFGQWKAEKIVRIIFFLGIGVVLFQLLNVIQFVALGLGLHEFGSMGFNVSYNFPIKSAFFGLFFIIVLFLQLILWKCICELLLIILRAFEVYYINSTSKESCDESHSH